MGKTFRRCQQVLQSPIGRPAPPYYKPTVVVCGSQTREHKHGKNTCDHMRALARKKNVHITVSAVGAQLGGWVERQKWRTQRAASASGWRAG